MSPLELALTYMDIVFDGEDMGALRPLFTDDFTFKGPLYEFDSAEGYIRSLATDPPEGFGYHIIHAFEGASSACIVYQFTKPGISIPMAQLFEISNGKISKLLLIFDTSVFT